MKLVHFTATWCQPCKMMKPMIDQIISERNDIEYEMIDIDEQPEVAKEQGIMGVPTFIIINDNEERRIVGAMTKQKFLESLDTTS